jgi:hypothetical protein
MSESEAAGRLTKMPGIVDAAATTPSQSVGVLRLVAKGFSTGDFDIVELSIAKKPMKQSMMKMLRLLVPTFTFICSQLGILSLRFTTNLRFFVIHQIKRDCTQLPSADLYDCKTS